MFGFCGQIIWLLATMVFLTDANLSPDNPAVFRTIEIDSSHKTTDSFLIALKAKGMPVGDWVKDILANRKFATIIPKNATEKIEIDLVIISVRDLGFNNGARLKAIYDKAQKIGLKLCPPEIGPLLRLQYSDQPRNEWLVIGSAPIADSEGGHGLFLMGHGGLGRWLLGYYGNFDVFWNSDYRFVFVLPRKPRRPL